MTPKKNNSGGYTINPSETDRAKDKLKGWTRRNKFLDLRKKITNPKILEKFLLRIVWLFTFYTAFHVVRNFFYLAKIKPLMLEMEIIPLMFFYQVHYFNIISLIICTGFLLAYYYNRNQKEVKI